VLAQVSPEGQGIFDFVLELYRTCSGDWKSLADDTINNDELNRFLTYAATFLSNVGNYYVRMALIPNLFPGAYIRCCDRDPATRSLFLL